MFKRWACCGWLLPGVLFSSGLTSTANADWQVARFVQADGVTNHISVTGKALGLQERQGHPRLRVSCETSYGGGELNLGFYFPAGHAFALQSTRNEPVEFRVGFSDTGEATTHAGSSGKVEYLFKSTKTVFHTTLASDGFATSYNTAELMLDLLTGDWLDVSFMHTPDRYLVRYSLKGFASSVQSAMQTCQLGDIAQRDLRANWQDESSFANLQLIATNEEPAYSAAKPVTSSVEE